MFDFVNRSLSVLLPSFRLMLFTSTVLISVASGATGDEKKGGEETYFRFLNETGGTFRDDECFWSLNGDGTWHSFAKEPRLLCPKGNGRVYLRLGAPPKNFDDREVHWDFIEFALDGAGWHGNTTQVDAFCLPMVIEVGDKKVGMRKGRRELFDAFRKGCPKEFRGCVKSEDWILSPCRAGFGADGPERHYFDKYIDEVWDQYKSKKATPSGKWMGEVVGGSLVFTPLGAGKPLSCDSKPSTQDAFLGTGVLATNPEFCAAINRHVLTDPDDWKRPEKFYQAEPNNWYAKFFHEHSIDRKAYGFCYDDVSDQAAFFSAKGKEVIIRVGW